MVVSRSDTKRRKKEDVAMVPTVQEESPKRAKVHAQRKFAQGSASLSSPSLTPVKDKTKPSEVVVPPKYIPSNRPKTEDFLTFLCFRGTSTLPPRLDFFNVATLQESLDEDPPPPAVPEQTARESPRTSRNISSPAAAAGSRRHRSCESIRADQATVTRPGPAKRNADPVAADTEQKPQRAVQALMKKYQDQRLAKQKTNTLSKLAQKVKGKNMVRTRSSGNCEEMVLLENHPTITPRKVTSKKKEVCTAKHHSRQIKRLLSNAKNRRGGLRSGGQLPAVNLAAFCIERSRRPSLPKTPPKQTKGPNADRSSGKMFISSLSDFSSDDDQPLLKKPRLFDRAVAQKGRTVAPKGRNMAQKGRIVAQKVKNRYAKQRPNKRLKPQIMTRSQLHMKALKEAEDKERKENLAKDKDMKKMKEKEAKEQEIKLKTLQEERRKTQEAQAIALQKAEKLEREDKELRKRERKETERIAKELKDKEIEKETREKAKRLQEAKDESEQKEKARISRQLELELEKEIKLKEKQDKEQEMKMNAFKVKSLCDELLLREREERSKNQPLASSSVPSRPSRKTKEAAAFYMEMLGKRLVDLGGEEDDDSQSMDSFPELPNAKRSEQREKEIKAKAIENNWTPGNNKNKSKTGSKLKSNYKGVPRNDMSKKQNITCTDSVNVQSLERFGGGAEMVSASKSSTPPQKLDQIKETSNKSGRGLPSTSCASVAPESATVTNAGHESAESFSDSDEEPLGKLAMRSRSSSQVERDKESDNTSGSKAASKPRRIRDIPVGGMKEALRESITHTPFLPRKPNAKLTVAKTVQRNVVEQVVEPKSEEKLLVEGEDRKIKILPDTLQQKEILSATLISTVAYKFVTNVVNIPIAPVAYVSCAKDEPSSSKTVDIQVKKEHAINESVSAYLEEDLKKNSEPRTSKAKVNMSTEQIEKWLNESCNQDPVRIPKNMSVASQIRQSEEALHSLDKANERTVVRTPKQHQQKVKQAVKNVGSRYLPESVPKQSTRIRREITTSIQSNSSAFKKSLNRAIEESIKDNADFIRRNSADAKAASVACKEVSPISGLSISTVSVSGIGESPCSRVMSSRSADDLREARNVKSVHLQTDRTPEKKSIFQRGQSSAHKAKQRKDWKPNTDAFSPENESSVYAFDNEPELPPMSKPFRRQPTRDSRASSVATSRSEDDFFSKLVDEEISTITQSCKPPQAGDRNIQHATAVSTSEEHLHKLVNEEAAPVGRSYLQSRVPRSPAMPVDCLLQPRGDELPPRPLSEVPAGDLNTSNTTSNSDEDLSAVRERLVRQRQVAPPAHLTLSSSSIAVQVNLDTEDEASPVDEASFFNQSLECSTQTEEEDDDANGHLFYIPLQPGAAGAHVTASGMIRGVAVKLGTEGPTGPNQRVIMRAKLVTKPPTFNRAIGPNNQENRSLLSQHVPRRPITALPADPKTSVGMLPCSNGTYPPIGTVQPTSRSLPHTAVQASSTQLNTAQPDNVPERSLVQHANIQIMTSTVPSFAQNPASAKSTTTNPALKAPSSSVNWAVQRKLATLYPSAYTAPGTLFAMSPTKHSAAQTKASELPGARPGTVKWALPHSINANRKESKKLYYSQTPDKVLVAKKEAFISAVPPLAPLSYAMKKPPAVATVMSKPSSGGPSQGQGLQGSVAKEGQRALPKLCSTLPPKLVPEKTAGLSGTTVKAVDAQNLPGPSAMPLKPYTGAKRGPKFQVKKVLMGKDGCRMSKVTNFPSLGSPSQMVEAPTFYPTEEEFQDPIEFIERIRPMAEKFGLCRIVPPKKFKPECKVSDDMRFTAYNQYVHKTLHRWGPNVKEMMAIRKYLATQNIILKQPPYIGSIEIDLPRLYQTVQSLGGLKEVILKARWQRVADDMKISKSAQDRATKLDDIYCKYLLPYETLSAEERTKLLEDVETSWNERELKAATSRANASTKPDDESLDEDEDEIDECIVKGRTMALNQFYRTARNTMHMWFKQAEPSAPDVETEFWKHVTARQSHLCVHSGSIESSRWGYGFPVSKNSPLAKHSWNLKVLTNNSGSVLRSMGPIMGVTVPTIHVGMLFTTCCWYRDPHGLPWVEYLHTGANKIWYGIPDEHSARFRTSLCRLVPRYVKKNKTIWLPSDTAMVPPGLLVESGVSLCRVVQEPGQFVVVYPRAFTSSICTGYLVSESVYFAQPSWLDTAEQVFKDIHGSCEPSMFSLERLLFSIATDARSSVQVLNQVLPMIQRIQALELDHRAQLVALGLKATDRLRLPEVSTKKRKSAAMDDDGDYECEICRANLYVSLVTNSHEEGVYCLPHAIELFTQQKHQLKYCKLLYMYNQSEMNSLLQKLKERIELKTQKKLHVKPSLAQLSSTNKDTERNQQLT